MSEAVKVGRNRPPQNGWASKEEVAELRAEVAELRETNQAMLEEIKGLRAELGGAKRRHLLGAVATSAAAFFGKFFHRGEDLGDFHDKKEHSKGAKKGAHAKGEEKEKEKGNTPIVPARRDEKSKNNSREKEDKRNKGKHPLAKKVAVFALAATIIGGAIAGISQCSSHDIKGSDAAVTMKAGNEDLENPAFGSTQASAEENDAAKAEADLQNKANEMGISVESMKRLADEHGMPYDKIGTDEAQHYLSDQLLAKNNIAEPFDASTPETAKESLNFYIFNDKDVCAEFYAALHENPEGEVDGLENPQDTIDYSEQFKNDPAAFNAARKEAIGALNEDGTKVTVREATDRGVITFCKFHEEGSDNGTLGVGENKEDSNGMNEKIVETNFANRGIVTWTKTGCAQNAAPATRVVREATATPIQAKQGGGEQKQEHHKKEQGEWNIKDHGHEEGEENTSSDQKDKHADDSQEREQDKNQESPQSKVGSEMTHDKQQHDKDGAPIVDNKGNMNGTQGDTSEDRPANKNNTEADNGGPGSGEHVAGGATNTGSGNRGGSDEGGTGSNEADSGGRGEETSQGSQKGGRSWTRDWDSSKGGSWTEDSDGNRTTESHEDSHDTGRVERNGDSSDTDGGDVELQSVPIRQQD